MNLRETAARGVFRTGVATLIVALLQVAQLVVLGRWLSDHELGLYAVVLLAVAVVQIVADAGLSAFVVHRASLGRTELSLLWRGNLWTGAFTFVAMWVTAPLISRWCGLPEVEMLLRVVALTAPVSALGSVFGAMLQKDMRFGTLGALQIGGGLVGFVVTVFGAYHEQGAVAATAGLLATACVQNLALLWIGVRAYRPDLSVRRVPMGRPWRFSLYQVGERTLYLLSLRIDQVVLLAMLGTHATGIYNLLQSMVSVPAQRLNPVLTRVALPTFARLQHERTELRRGYLMLVNLLLTVDTLLLAGLAATAPLLLPLVFGAERAEHVPLLQIMCFVALTRAVGNPMGSLVLATGRARASFSWSLWLFVVSVPTVVIGAALGGALGVALGLAVLQVAVKVPAYRWLVRPSIGACGAEYADAIVRPFAIGLLMAIAIAVLLPWLGHDWLALGIATAVGGIVYFALCALGNRAAIREVRRALHTLGMRGARPPIEALHPE